MNILNPSPLCHGCSHSDKGIKRHDFQGTGSNGVMLVTDTPLMYQGAPSYQLDKLLRRAGTERKDFWQTSLVSCHPSGKKWFKQSEAWEILAYCREHLRAQIEKVQPRAILALGDVALRALCNAENLLIHHSYVHDSEYGIPVIPTWDPETILFGKQNMTPMVVFAIRRALGIAHNGFTEYPEPQYVLDRPLAECEAYFKDWNPNDVISVDIENPVKDKLDEDEEDELEESEVKDDISFAITRIGFSYRKGTGISMPWCEPFISLSKEVLRQAKAQLYWNRNHDVPRLAFHGAEFNGDIFDGMWGWHFLQSDVPKKLGFVAPFYFEGRAWKHLNIAEPAFYNAVDNDAALSCHLGIRADLEKQGRWDTFYRHCVKTLPMLLEMGSQGVLVDRAKQAVFKQELQADLEETYVRLQQKIPQELKNYKIFKSQREPKEITREPKNFNEYLTIKYSEVSQVDGQWRRTFPFNFDSSDQVKKVFNFFNIKIPTNRSNGKETTGGKYLARFGKKNEIFKLLHECRKRADMIGSFIYPLGSDDRIRTIYTFNPSTWRKSSKKKGAVYVDGRWEPSSQLQNIPKRDPLLAKRLRKTMVASPGCVLIEADSSAIEAVLVGYAAGDQDYIRLAKAGVHDYLTAHLVGRPVDKSLPFEELSHQLKSIKKEFKEKREQAKRCIHGGNYKLSAFGLHDEYPEFFPTQKAGQQLLDFYFGLFPSISAWHKSTLERAHKESYLDNDFGYRHYFYDVFNYDRDSGGWKLGNDAKRAIAFKPQSNASAIQTEYLLQLADDEQVRPCMRLVIHDSIVLEVPKDQAQEVAWKVYSVMTSPIAQLQGLSIGAEVQIGESLGEMEVLEFDKNKGLT